MAHTTNIKKSTKKALLLFFFILLALTSIYVQYYSPVNTERACKNIHPILVGNIRSCSPIKEILSTLKADGYMPITLESSKDFGGIFRAEFNRNVFEIPNYQILGDENTGAAQFQFINGRLSAIIYFPTEPDLAFELYPEKKSKDITVEHLTNYQGRIYIYWSNNSLEKYISWWVRRFS